MMHEPHKTYPTSDPATPGCESGPLGSEGRRDASCPTPGEPFATHARCAWPGQALHGARPAVEEART